MGVTGIKLDDNDKVVSLEVLPIDSKREICNFNNNK